MIKLSRKKITVVLAAIAFMLIAAACCLLQEFYSASAEEDRANLTSSYSYEEILNESNQTISSENEVNKSLSINAWLRDKDYDAFEYEIEYSIGYWGSAFDLLFKNNKITLNVVGFDGNESSSQNQIFSYYLRDYDSNELINGPISLSQTNAIRSTCIKLTNASLAFYKTNNYHEPYPDKVEFAVGTTEYELYKNFFMSGTVKFGQIDSSSFWLSERLTLYKEKEIVSTLPLPETPVKEGHTFTGWYYGANFQHGENCVPYDGGPITEETALHAHFTVNTYTVSFDSAGGNELPKQTVTYNTALNLDEPVRKGYDFVGWFFEDGTEYTSQGITEDITLTAHWEIKHFKVTFYVGDVVYRELSVDWGTSLVDAAVKAEICAESILSYRTANGENGSNPKEKFVEEDIEVYATEVCEKNPLEKYEWAIIGGVCGGIVLIAIIAACCVIGKRKKKEKGGKAMPKNKNKKGTTVKKRTSVPVTQPKQTGKGRAGWGKVWKSILVIVLVAILGIGAVGVTYICTDGFGGKVKTMIVTIGDEVFSESAEGLAIYPDTNLRLISLTGSGSYSVTVRATAQKGSFPFLVGDEQYEWADVAGKDFTKGFQFENTAQGFKLGYDSLASIIASGFSESVKVEELSETADMFEMEIVCGKSKLVFGFSVGLPVTGVEIDKDQIVM